jgi:hypothetical protein
VGEDGVGGVVVAEAGVHDGVGGRGTSSDRVRPAIGVGPACGMAYGGGLGSIGGKRAGGAPAVPRDTGEGTGEFGLGLGLGIGYGGSGRSRSRAL